MERVVAGIECGKKRLIGASAVASAITRRPGYKKQRFQFDPCIWQTPAKRQDLHQQISHIRERDLLQQIVSERRRPITVLEHRRCCIERQQLQIIRKRDKTSKNDADKKRARNERKA